MCAPSPVGSNAEKQQGKGKKPPLATGGATVSEKLEKQQKYLQHITKAVIVVQSHGSSSWGLKRHCQEGRWFPLCSAGPGPLPIMFSLSLITHPGSLKLMQSCSLWDKDVVRGSLWKSVALERGEREREKTTIIFVVNEITQKRICSY